MIKIKYVDDLSINTKFIVWSLGAIANEFLEFNDVIVFKCYFLYFNALFGKINQGQMTK